MILDDGIPPNNLFILILAGTCAVLFCSGKGIMIQRSEPCPQIKNKSSFTLPCHEYHK